MSSLVKAPTISQQIQINLDQDGADPTSTTDSVGSKFVDPSLDFNPERFNLPVRLFGTCIFPTTANTAFRLPFLSANNPTAKEIRTFLDDVEAAGFHYAMTATEMIGMAFYYVDPNNKMLWKRMINIPQTWQKFKERVLWYYPDAFFDADEVIEIMKRDSLKAIDRRSDSLVFGIRPRSLRAYIIMFLRLEEDVSESLGLISPRELCIRFAKGMPGNLSKQSTNRIRWKVSVCEMMREKYPEMKDDFDCPPDRFFYHAFLVWRQEFLFVQGIWLNHDAPWASY